MHTYHTHHTQCTYIHTIHNVHNIKIYFNIILYIEFLMSYSYLPSSTPTHTPTSTLTHTPTPTSTSTSQWNSNNSNLSIEDIDKMRQNIINNIALFNLNKSKIAQNEFNVLMNYHYFNLNILDNIKLVKLAQLRNPINNAVFQLTKYDSKESYNNNELKDLYKTPKMTNLWDLQFDPMVINPQCETLPSSNVWALNRPLKDPNFL